MTNNVLKDINGNILNFYIPRYEKLKSNSLIFVKLWEDMSSPTEISEKNVILSSSDYDFIIWFAHQSVVNYQIDFFAINSKGTDVEISGIVQSNVSIHRLIKRKSDTLYTIQNGYSETNVNNNNVLPYKAIGVKLGTNK